MTTHAIGFAGCSILLLQRALYERRGPSRLQTRLAALHAWRSLGGFGGLAPPDSSELLLSRRAFDLMDEDGDGFLTPDELTRAVLELKKRAGGAHTRDEVERLVQRMMLVGDSDGDGRIDAEEYRRLEINLENLIPYE
ncbi:hypothetical protein EMIHUDRAFT_233889 [Emiliania huxleyi CCMP1516]|uniref:EF-hand domain-containing protein n=2 Tax=Emiliania huxleyi TaxID=2903 RepID=A0A0D3K180_EMIH1|nr:hypothetical protein EMIHUDRAFT_245052 [Emiliania huxleyi CCMP1516]XP_005781944.1 hypothetical protein EMIHUDRAFT_233889 [Emiliania huxleyi CCMP1516]EOD16506.1 hypothetical protein EMIHUDRAFT_245052 [Emiliania huxleyi CCMP1516]EOD29515.1 hypothetical protein EMIHUDRAFT_233889 [Emiliania huxleyi CCMP1516]|eukprot:XP_005768935.1 hypothetical protein EMIHUDRAFT_245052 [Emiliania huxleyi CCMP1516]